MIRIKRIAAKNVLYRSRWASTPHSQWCQRCDNGFFTNIRQHAEARYVTISLVMSPETVTLTIEDDGCGFDPSEVQEGHYGLVGMNERVKLAGGKMTLRSSPGEGTGIEATIPIEG